MCEHCMRPGNFSAPVQKVEDQPKQEGPQEKAVPVCSECRQKLHSAPDNGFYCSTCGNPPWFQRMFIEFHCPKCEVRLQKDGQALKCPRCQAVCRRP